MAKKITVAGQFPTGLRPVWFGGRRLGLTGKPVRELRRIAAAYRGAAAQTHQLVLALRAVSSAARRRVGRRTALHERMRAKLRAARWQEAFYKEIWHVAAATARKQSEVL